MAPNCACVRPDLPVGMQRARDGTGIGCGGGSRMGLRMGMEFSYPVDQDLHCRATWCVLGCLAFLGARRLAEGTEAVLIRVWGTLRAW